MKSTRSRLALQGGAPVRSTPLPYGRQWVDEDDIRAVAEVLRSGWLTTGPEVARFEQAVADAVGAREAVAISSGTAALHAVMHALGIGPGDEVIVPAMTFAATANAVLYVGGRPVFADVCPDTLLLDVESAERCIGPRTRAIVAVDYAGQPCDYDALRAQADRHGLALVADACHSLGATDQGRPVGSLADLNVFSFHPVKHITTGEGGMITTRDAGLADRMRQFRNHGITTDHRQREKTGTWYYEMVELGFNYRLSDFQCALGWSQLQKLPAWVARRQQIASFYAAAFASHPLVRPLRTRVGATHAYHLYVIGFRAEALDGTRADWFAALRAEGIGVNVHYIPVHLHPYYRRSLGTGPGMCPQAERAYERIVSLPIFPAMEDTDAESVIEAVCKVTEAYVREGARPSRSVSRV